MAITLYKVPDTGYRVRYGQVLGWCYLLLLDGYTLWTETWVACVNVRLVC